MENKKLTKIVGIKKEEFDELVTCKQLHVRKALLIPVAKLGDELALASVILSSIKLIKEFRKMIFSEVKLIPTGQVFVYTEVTFPEFKNYRVDGLILVVKNGIIKDAALLEMKNGKDVLEREQIEHYLNIAKNMKIPKLITVSNQFVAHSNQFPISVKKVKAVTTHHFSWSYLLTLAHILLIKNDTNIEDIDRASIMEEVVTYLEHDKSGVCGFNQMSATWSSLVDKVNSGAKLNPKDPDVIEGARSWQQEEADMALILSRHLGVLVTSGRVRQKGKLEDSITADIKKLITKHILESKLKVRGAASDIRVSALFEKRTVEMAVQLDAPDGKTTKGQFGWLMKQIDNCWKKNQGLYNELKGELFLEVDVKNSNRSERLPVLEASELLELVKGKDIKGFQILYIKDFGKKFSSPRKFVEIIEKRLVDFYSGIVQHLAKWEPSPPKMVEVDRPSASEAEIKSEGNEATESKTDAQ